MDGLGARQGDTRPLRHLDAAVSELFYDGDAGKVIEIDRWIREEISVRVGLREQVIREAVIVELERLGYTVTPP